MFNMNNAVMEKNNGLTSLSQLFYPSLPGIGSIHPNVLSFFLILSLPLPLSLSLSVSLSLSLCWCFLIFQPFLIVFKRKCVS